MATKDIAGQKFGRLLVLGQEETPLVYKSGKTCRRWICRCDCGVEKPVAWHSLVAGRTSSCGCLQRELNGNQRRKHGMSRHPEYNVWNAMITRCTNENAANYKDYGGRGIAVTDWWRGPGGFEHFLADMGHRPSRRHTLERINNDGDYEPGNVRWATYSEQARNRRNTRFVVIDGQKRAAVSVAQENGIPGPTFNVRVNDLGWDVLRAATQPLRSSKTKGAEAHAR